MSVTLAQAKAAMLAKALSSGLKPADVSLLKLTAHTAESLEDSITGLPQYVAGFTIPYFDLHGKTTKFFRVRYTEAPTGFAALTGKPLRYAQPAKTTNELYMPPFVDWKEIAKDVAVSLLITEGELKSACATKLGVATLGLGGVTMFGDRKHGNFVLPALKQFTWEGRRAYVVFDSDAATNPDVLRAESMLCRELTQLGAILLVTRLPKLTDDGKTGLDDFLMSEGVDALMELLPASPMYSMAKGLHELNEEVIYINTPDIVYNPVKDIRMRTDKFCTSHYANRRLLVMGEKGPVEKSAAQEWMKWERRSEVLNFTYVPGESTFVDGHLNLWQPWPYVPKKGDVSIWHRVMDHIFTDTEAESRKWFEQWVAFPMQHPGTKLKTACILWGGQGTGKSFVAETIMRVYGEHNATKFDNMRLNSNFNDWAEHKQFAVGEEIVVNPNEKKAVAEMLKTLITDTTININRKYVNSYRLPNCMNLMALSNHAASMKLEEDDRRWFVHQVKSAKMQPELYRPFDVWSKSAEGLSALFHYFLTLDLSGFDPQAAAPHTYDRLNMITGGRSVHGDWIANVKVNPDETLVLGKARVSYSLFTSDDLMTLFYAKHERSSITAATMSNELAMQGFMRAYPGPIRTQTGSKRLWVIRPDAAFRKMSPQQLGEWYDRERGREVKKQPKEKKR
jgi:hypothetical protein